MQRQGRKAPINKDHPAKRPKPAKRVPVRKHQRPRPPKDSHLRSNAEIGEEYDDNLDMLTGRPTEFRINYPRLLETHMAQGFTFNSFAGEVDVTPKTLYRWLAAYPEFKRAREIGEARRQKVLEAVGLKIATTGKGNASAWAFIMKNTHGWTDNLTVTPGDPDDTGLDTETIRERRRKRIEELEAKRRALPAEDT